MRHGHCNVKSTRLEPWNEASTGFEAAMAIRLVSTAALQQIALHGGGAVAHELLVVLRRYDWIFHIS